MLKTRLLISSSFGADMPILALEPQMYPPELFEPRALPLNDRVWWVLHTKPRQEKSLARHLHAAHIPFYLPLAPRRLQVATRTMTSHNPLFPSYVFLLANQHERVTALTSSRVVNSLRVSDQDRLVNELAQVYRLIQTGAPLALEDRLVPGTVVEIQSGPLAGLRGKIVQETTRRRFIVEVDFIQRGASILLDGHSLMPISGI